MSTDNYYISDRIYVDKEVDRCNRCCALEIPIHGDTILRMERDFPGGSDGQYIAAEAGK